MSLSCISKNIDDEMHKPADICRTTAMMSFIPREHQKPERPVQTHARHARDPDVPMAKTDYVTTSKASQATVFSQATSTSERGCTPPVAAGGQRSRLCGYNILNGGAPLVNNPKFECFEPEAVVQRARTSELSR